MAAIKLRKCRYGLPGHHIRDNFGVFKKRVEIKSLSDLYSGVLYLDIKLSQLPEVNKFYCPVDKDCVFPAEGVFPARKLLSPVSAAGVLQNQ